MTIRKKAYRKNQKQITRKRLRRKSNFRQKGFFSFKHIFRIFAAEKKVQSIAQKISSYKFSTATAILGYLKQTTIKNN